MATVIESLIVTLGLDATNFRRGTADATRARNTLGDTNRRQDAETSAREKKLAAEQARRGKEADARAKAMADGFRKVRNEALSLFALFTAGVGIKNFIANTIESAVQLGYLSQNLKVSIESLQAYGRAAERAGGTTEGAFAQLRESADSLAALRSGLGPNEGMQWFFRMGGSSDDLKDGNTYLMARSKIISEMFNRDPQRAMLISKQMGISEDQFNLIKQGPDAIKRLTDAQMKNSAISAKDAEGALELKNKWLDFSQAMTATGTKILVALIPAFSQLMNWLQTVAGWVTDNKDLIGAWVADFVTKAIPVMQKIGKFLAELDWEGAANRLKLVGDAIVTIAQALQVAVDLMRELIGSKSGSKGVLDLGPFGRIGQKSDLEKQDAADAAAGRKPRAAGKTITTDAYDMKIARVLSFFGSDIAKQYMKERAAKDAAATIGNSTQGASVVSKLMGMGWTKEQAAGIAGSLQQESGINPGATNPQSGAYGIGQWLAPRRADFKAWSGKDIYGSSLDEQLAFQQYEMTQGKERAAGTKLRAARTAADAARIHSESYERPGAAEANIPQRQAYASEILARVGASNAVQRGNSSTSTSTSDVKIGSVTIQTQATDAKGMAADAANALRAKFRFSDQANSGMQ